MGFLSIFFFLFLILDITDVQAEHWVNTMTKVVEEKTIEVEPEGRPYNLVQHFFQISIIKFLVSLRCLKDISHVFVDWS